MKLLRRSATARAPSLFGPSFDRQRRGHFFCRKPAPARVPPFKGALLTQEACFIPPDGLARPRLTACPVVDDSGGVAPSIPPFLRPILSPCAVAIASPGRKKSWPRHSM